MNDPPVLLMIAGPNGSGKTTLTTQLRSEGIDLGIYINPDDIAAGLTGTYDWRVAEAQRIADQLRQDCLNRRVSFSFETVMSHPSKIDILKQARALGYFVVVYFIGTEDPQLNVERVWQRVTLGGHDVPNDRIVSRYDRAMKLLPAAIRQSDRTVLLDNSYHGSGNENIDFVPVCLIVREQDKLFASGHKGSPVPDWAMKYAIEPMIDELVL